MSQNNLFFTESYSSFQDKNVAIDINTPLNNDVYFGILKLNAISCPCSSLEQEFIFNVDRSGSMSDLCSDGRSKMQHITHTIKNMVKYFVDNPSIKLHITIFAFDDKFVTILERTQINDDNYLNIMKKIEKISPTGSTNIEKALSESREYISTLKREYPSSKINHIFLTDGDATCGNKDKNILYELVDKDITNAFIGFGINHDALLLNYIANRQNSSYHFVDALEKAGLIYGEILHGILYKLLTDVVITIQNGLVYNYKTNTWDNHLCIGDIVGEANKTYHIISSCPEECAIVLSCNQGNDKFNICIDKLINHDADHTKYIYRQKTLELLYLVNEFQMKKKNLQTTSSCNLVFLEEDDNQYDEIKDEQTKLKTNLRDFITELKIYMLNNRLQDDSFLKNLCDDIYITYRTLGTNYGAMYCGARQTSQGTQRCYTVSQTPDETIGNRLFGFPPPPILRRRNNRVTINTLDTFDAFDTFDTFDNNSDMDILPTELEIDLEHEVSDFDQTPYLTPTATQLMRAVSDGRKMKKEDKDEETLDIY